MRDVSANINKHLKELEELAITPEGLAKMINLIKDGTLSSKMAKKVFAHLIENGGDPEVYVKEQGLVQISDEGELQEIVSGIRSEERRVGKEGRCRWWRDHGQDR